MDQAAPRAAPDPGPILPPPPGPGPGAAEQESRIRGEALFRELVRRLPVPVALNDPQGRITALNERFTQVLGYAAEDLPTVAEWFALAYPDPAYRGQVLARWGEALAHGPEVPADEYRVRTRSGAELTMLISGVKVEDHLVVVLLDLTDRKRAEEALRHGEFLSRSVLEHYPRGVMALFDRDLRLILHEGTRSAFVEEPGRLVGQRPADFAPPELAARLEAAFREALAGRQGHLELEGRGRTFDVHTTPIRGADGQVAMGMAISEDTTEPRRLQAQLEVTRRLAALGTLVAGIGHEVNNPLGAALASTGFAAEQVARLRERLRSGEPPDREEVGRCLEELAGALDDAQAGGERVAAIVRDFSSFGKADPERRPVHLPDVVDGAMRWLRAAVAGGTALCVEARDVPVVLASPGQVQQVVVNLVTNAAKAIPSGRRGSIAIRMGPGAPGMGRLEVSDDGVGMAPEVLDRIFDPFFTTRKVGEGMGLGLAISHSLVTAQGGTIAVESAPGAGTTFRVELPAVAGAAAPG